jgi:hypothetical protein
MGCWNFLAANTVKSAIHTPKRPNFAPSSIIPDCICPENKCKKIEVMHSKFESD